MDVQKLVNTVARLSLDERTPDLNTQDDILTYVNIVYGAMLADLSDLPSQIGRFTTTHLPTSDSNGQITLTDPNVSVKNVYMKSNGSELTATDLKTIEKSDPFFEQVGTPTKFFLTGLNKIQIYPARESEILKVRYMPQPNTLVIASTEADIRIPPAHHNYLIFAALVFIGIDERDKGALSLLSVYEIKAKEAKQTLLSYMARQPSDALFTEAY